MQNTLPPGTIIRGRYLVQEILAKGGFGAVYLVRDQHNNFNPLVLKEVINPNKHKLYRLSIEAMSLRLLHHQALPHVYNVISEGKHDRVYILTDYIEGPNVQTLRLQQPEKRFSLPQVMTIMLPIMEAVSYLHSQQPPIIHQDIKPTNIIVPTTSDKAVLVDYGIDKKYSLDSTSSTLGRSLTTYEAPEQYNEEPSTRTDIYGLGATFYTLLTGIVPVDALSRKIQLESKRSDPLEPVNKVIPRISPPVAESIHRAMSLSSNDRFATVEQFVQALKVAPAWKLSAIEKREFDQALKAAPIEQMSSEPFIASATPPNSPIVPEQEEVISAPPVEGRGAPEAEEGAPEPTPVLKEGEAQAEAEVIAEPTEVRGAPEVEEAAPEPTPVLKEGEARAEVEAEAAAEPTEVRGVPEAEEGAPASTPVAKLEETELAPEPLVKPAEVGSVPEAEESRPALMPVAKEEEIRPTAEAVAQQEAREAPAPVVKEEEIKPALTPISEQPRNAGSRKPAVLVLILLALFVGIIIGAVFGTYAVSHYGPGFVTPTPSLPHKATSSIHTPSPALAATTSVSLVGSYNGTIYNLATNVTTKMSLTY